MTFAEKLRFFRSQNKLTQHAVADAAGISRRMYLYYESGQKYPRKRETVEKLAAVLGVELFRLLPENDKNLAKRFSEMEAPEQEAFLKEACLLYRDRTDVSPEQKQQFLKDVKELFEQAPMEEPLNVEAAEQKDSLSVTAE